MYVYQCWDYRVDMMRVNEFGFGGEDGEDSKKVELEGIVAQEGTNLITTYELKEAEIMSKVGEIS